MLQCGIPFLFPSEYAINPHRGIPTHDSGIALEMMHPNNIDCSTGVLCNKFTAYAHKDNIQKSRSQWVRDQFKLGQIRDGHLQSMFYWLDSEDLSNKLKTLNKLYKDCVTARDIKGFHKLVNSSTKEVYLSKLKMLKMGLAYRNKHWILSKVLLPLCFFASFTRWFDTVAETVVVDNTYDKIQTHWDFFTTEKL